MGKEEIIAKRLKESIDRLDLSYSTLSEMTNIPRSALQRYATGETKKIPVDRLEKLAQTLGVSTAYLFGWIEPETEPPKPPTKGIRINVLGRIAAGVPIEAVEEIIDWEEITPEMAENGKHFGLLIDGDSMEPKFSKGDVVIVRQQSDVDSGQIAVVMVNGSDATVKRIKKLPSGIMLMPTNPKFEARFYTYEEINTMPVVVLGRVVELRAKF